MPGRDSAGGVHEATGTHTLTPSGLTATPWGSLKAALVPVPSTYPPLEGAGAFQAGAGGPLYTQLLDDAFSELASHSLKLPLSSQPES